LHCLFLPYRRKKKKKREKKEVIRIMNMISYFCFCRFFPNFFFVPQRLLVVVDIDTMETLSSGVSTVVSSSTKHFCIVPTTKDPTASVKIGNGKTH
jgi:hypothetical protein